VEIPIDPTAPWKGAIVVTEVDDAIKKMAHVALTTLYERHLTDTTHTPITLFPIHGQEEPEFSARWVHMAKYA
jgi:hypothetical protein